MAQSIINKIIKSVALLGVMLACQSSFAGVGIYMSVTNGTKDNIVFSSCIYPYCNIDPSELNVTEAFLLPNKTVKNAIYRELRNSDNDVPDMRSAPIYYTSYENGEWNQTLICEIAFKGTSYKSSGPRVKNAEQALTQYNNKQGYTCQAAPIRGISGALGDTIYLSVTVN